MSFEAPQLFTNYGKLATDLFKKKFEFDTVKVTVTQKAQDGLEVESGAVNVSDEKNYWRGYNIFKLARPAWGNGELELHTDAKQSSKVSAKFTKLYPGLISTVTLANSDKADLLKGAKQVVTVESTYAFKNTNSSLTLKSDVQNKLKVDGSTSVGYENWSVGASATYEQDNTASATSSKDVAVDLIPKTKDPLSFQVGVEYRQADLTASVFTNVDKKQHFLNASFFHRLSRDYVSGAQWKYNMEKQSHTVTLGSDLKVDADTGLKYKLELPTGSLQVAVEHRLSNPQVKVGVASEFNVKDVTAPQSTKLGFQFSFGDF